MKITAKFVSVGMIAWFAVSPAFAVVPCSLMHEHSKHEHCATLHSGSQAGSPSVGKTTHVCCHIASAKPNERQAVQITKIKTAPTVLVIAHP